ncbi:MAG: 6-carboxyhexanoate--CoA ligase [Paraclostridium sordellii]
MDMSLYSIKMRSSKGLDGVEKHISGAENIVNETDLENAVNNLIKRALNHTKGKSDSINIKVEKLNELDIKYINPLSVNTIDVKNHIEGFDVVKQIIKNLGIDEKKCEYIIKLLKKNSNMRGAILLDVNTLERLEKDKLRGIRATYMDFENNNINLLSKSINTNAHFLEALALSSKVISCNEVLAEICYSDDPNYTTGYVASKKYGYVRITNLKEVGSENGGRIFLYDSLKDNLQRCIDYIENKKVIVKNTISINETISYDEFMKNNELIKK